MEPLPDDAGVYVLVRGSVVRARINGAWYEGDPYHRLVITSGEYDQEGRCWNALPTITWQKVTKEDWRRM